MLCSNCQTENQEEAKFCANCGKFLSILSSVIYASFGRRLAAYLLDNIIIAVSSMIISIVLIFILAIVIILVSGNSSRANISNVVDVLMFIVPMIIAILFTYPYWIYLTGKNGQTIGKKLLHIKVIRLDGVERVGYLKAFLRDVIGKGLSLWALGFGFLWMLWDGKKQTWADKIAETIVIKA